MSRSMRFVLLSTSYDFIRRGRRPSHHPAIIMLYELTHSLGRRVKQRIPVMDAHQTMIGTKIMRQCYHDSRPKSATIVPPLTGENIHIKTIENPTNTVKKGVEATDRSQSRQSCLYTVGPAMMFSRNKAAVPVYKKLIINCKLLFVLYIILWIKFVQFNSNTANIGI